MTLPGHSTSGCSTLKSALILAVDTSRKVRNNFFFIIVPFRFICLLYIVPERTTYDVYKTCTYMQIYFQDAFEGRHVLDQDRVTHGICQPHGAGTSPNETACIQLVSLLIFSDGKKLLRQSFVTDPLGDFSMSSAIRPPSSDLCRAGSGCDGRSQGADTVHGPQCNSGLHCQHLPPLRRIQCYPENEYRVLYYWDVNIIVIIIHKIPISLFLKFGSSELYF
jgi:hypothetical protein